MADPVGVSFEIHVVGDETQETFTGKFFAKEKLSWQDQLNIDRIRRELLGANAADADPVVFQRATVIAELSARISSSPDWWKTARGGLDVIDDNVVMEVYAKAQEVRAKWLDAQKQKGEAAKAALAAKQGA